MNSRQTYTNDNFPCLVAGGEQLENPEQAKNLQALYHINARNALRHLTYGTPFFYGSSFTKTNLYLGWLNFKSLVLKKNPAVLTALREELGELFKNAYRLSSELEPLAEIRLEAFINTLLSNFPFMDPQEGEKVLLPQKIKGKWRQVSYQFKKIDISPKTGWRARWLEEEDRIYAYGLEPAEREANPYLLLMGTTYLTGQGASLSWLSDVTPGLSVGESHELSELSQWVLRQKEKIKISGHSQGATMAMMVAAQFYDKTLEAHCLNPAALHQNTLDRLNRQWHALGKNHPDIRVYSQTKDPVFHLGHGFLKGTRLFQVSLPKVKHYSHFAAHAHHFMGHRFAAVTEVKLDEAALKTRKRAFGNALKYVADRILSPIFNVGFLYRICKRKFLRFCSEHPRLLRGLLFLASFTACLALLGTGVLSPAMIALLFPAFKSLAAPAAYTIMTAVSAVASALASYVLPIALEFCSRAAYTLTGIALYALAGSVLLLTALTSALSLLTGDKAVPVAQEESGSTPKIKRALSFKSLKSSLEPFLSPPLKKSQSFSSGISLAKPLLGKKKESEGPRSQNRLGL